MSARDDFELQLARVRLRAQELLEDGQYEDAMRYAGAGLENDPTDASLLVLAAECAAGMARPQEAELLYAQAVIGHLEQDDPYRALDVCQALLEVNPGHQRALEHLVERVGQGKQHPGRQLPVLSEMAPEHLKRLLKRARIRTYREMETVCAVGEPAESTFLILDGSVILEKRVPDSEEPIRAHLERGSFFGEIAVVPGRLRNAGVVADREARILEISRELLREVMPDAAAVDGALVRAYQGRMLSNILAASPMFESLGSEIVEAITRVLRHERVEARQVMIEAGQAPRALYFILAGEVEVREPEVRTLLYKLRDGDVFGETALLDRTPAPANVVAKKASVLLKIERSDFEALTETYPALKNVLRNLAEGRRRHASSSADPYAVGNFMTRAFRSVNPTAPLDQVVQMMHEQKISCAIVCAGARPVGMISERDVVRLVAQSNASLAFNELKAKDVMAQPLLTVSVNDSLNHCLRVAKNRKVRRFPVVDEQGRLAGVLTQTDLVRVLSDKVAKLAGQTYEETQDLRHIDP